MQILSLYRNNRLIAIFALICISLGLDFEIHSYAQQSIFFKQGISIPVYISRVAQIFFEETEVADNELFLYEKSNFILSISNYKNILILSSENNILTRTRIQNHLLNLPPPNFV